MVYCKISYDGGWANGKLVETREGTNEMCILCICEGETRRLYARAYRTVAEYILGEDASADRTNEDWQVTFFF